MVMRRGFLLRCAVLLLLLLVVVRVLGSKSGECFSSPPPFTWRLSR